MNTVMALLDVPQVEGCLNTLQKDGYPFCHAFGLALKS